MKLPPAMRDADESTRSPRLTCGLSAARCLVLMVSLLLVACGAGRGASLEISITPKVSGGQLQPASLRYQTAARDTFSITRVSYLLSDFALQRPDGSWLELSNSVAWFDYDQKRDQARLDHLPVGEFRSLRFCLGLNPRLNHLDVTNFPAGHPLNPTVNDLHWSWQGGFIFLALEGLWRNPAGQWDGWAYHLARDTNATTITLAAQIALTNETRVDLDFDLAALLNSPRPLSFNREGSSTHSRDGDPIAAALVKNVAGAFRVQQIAPLTAAEVAAARPQPLYLPKKFTPHPFRMSATFPMPALPKDNPLLTERVELGQKLFFDRRLSINDRQSCADCHQADKAFSDGRRTAQGAEGDLGTRNSMPLFNLAWKKDFFWDGRSPTLRAQVLEPIQNPIEMHQSLTNLVAKLTGATNGDYAAPFEAAFGSPEITSEKISLALENYLLSLTSFNAKFDRVQRGEDKFTDTEQRGFELFATEYDPRRGQFGADCFHCHGGMLFQSQSFANNGLNDTFADTGRGKITGKTADAGKFSVPSLRNVELTGPYMHDGRFQSLEAVVAHYCAGVKRSATLDPNLAKHPDGGVPLTAADQKAIVAFLKTLTDEGYRSATNTTKAIASTPH